MSCFGRGQPTSQESTEVVACRSILPLTCSILMTLSPLETSIVAQVLSLFHSFDWTKRTEKKKKRAQPNNGCTTCTTFCKVQIDEHTPANDSATSAYGQGRRVYVHFRDKAHKGCSWDELMQGGMT